KSVRWGVLPMLVLSSAAGAYAATDSTTFKVKITITESCDIHTTAATDVDFGSHARSTGLWDAAGNLVVNCSQGTPYNIGLNEGLNSTAVTASATNRRMALGGNYVPYGLYRDSGRTQFWGNVIGTDALTGTGTAANVNVPVYGRVPSASTNVPAGTYVDTVTATITY
ncbi:MAG TPA: spore coat U domain-containing protein, partial [Burkholderiaceae bacterium]